MGSNLIHIITVGEWNYYSKTNDYKRMKGVNSKNIVELTEAVDKRIQGDDGADLNKKADMMNAKFKIQELRVFHRNLSFLFIRKLEVEIWLMELDTMVDAPLGIDIGDKLDNAIKDKV